MPWCPNCKTEYREGITLCADCKVELVAEYKDVVLKNATELLVKVDEEHQMFIHKLHDFLEYSQIPSVVLTELEMTALYVAPEDYSKAKKCFKAYYSVETEMIAQRAEEAAFLKGESFEDYFGDAEDDSDEPETEAFSSVNAPEKASPRAASEDMDNQKYVSASAKYEDYRSSGYTFTILGGIGVGIALLNFMDVLSLFGGGFSSGVLLLIFAIFLGLGLFSFSKANSLKNAADVENRLIEEVKGWMEQNFTSEIMASLVDEGDVVEGKRTAELLYLDKVDQLVGMVKTAFPYLHDTLAEQLVEEFCNQNSEEI